MPRKHRPLRPREPKACTACARAKVRCEVSGALEVCTRCLRLNRECIMQASGAHKRVGRESESSDVARLEEKLDSMAAAFTAQTPLSIQSGPVGEASDSRSILGDGIFPTAAEAQSLLTTFQTELSPYFPFIAIPMGSTVAELQRTNPSLLSTIMMVSCQSDTDRQLAMTQRVREYIGASTRVKGERDLDCLQGLLVCLAWYHYQLDLGSQFCSFLHLAMAMVAELGIGRKSAVSRMVHLDGSQRDPARQNPDGTLEDKRAYLGCFYLSAIAWICTEDVDPMRYTAYTEDCCRVLESAGGSTDLYLVRLVRLHRMVDRIEHTLFLNVYGFYAEPSTPLSTRIETFEAELQGIKPLQAPYNLHDCKSLSGYAFREKTILLMSLAILKLHHITLEAKLYSIALEDDFPRHETHPSTRLNLLSSCLSAIKAFLDLFAAIPTRNYPTLPYPVFCAYCFVLGTLSNLLLFTSEGWHSEHVRSAVDFEGVINAFVAKIENAPGGGHGQYLYQFPEAFLKIIPRLRAIVEAHRARRAARTDTASQRYTGEAPDSSDDDHRDLMFPLPHGFSWRFLQS
ncbi:hypothetical protein BJY01DRAFT_186522 [Aspergillus pseudoustus]|uniref:Zn(2)-C6 fungal-type domain-containing protein n=1 Tax=Aspergillus pseudoustus TaxID=1810923 RepID=A0ABR4JX31_9EURO